MMATFKIPRGLLEEVHRDLSRPHRFAAERVGFLACQLAEWPAGGIGIIAQTYLPVADEHYEDDRSVGAMMNSHAIRAALQHAYNHRSAMFHVHRHEHAGVPRFSHVDDSESRRFVPDFWKVQPKLAHGALVLSHDRIHGLWWDPKTRERRVINKYTTVGFPTTTFMEAA